MTREDSSFFISYAHADAAYVAKLADRLAAAGLPVWFDDHLAWGSRFPFEIQRRIMDALAIIVIMSPDAQASKWVELEILEGQRHDREFLPVLLAGERLFLLASSHYLDARDGSLPGDREIRLLKDLRDAWRSGTDQRPSLLLPAPALQFEVPTVRVPTDVSLHKLWSFLEEGQLEHADILTTSLLLEAVDRLDPGWMRRGDTASLPTGLLAEIDSGWSMLSQGVHGFGAQLARYPAPPAGAPPGGDRDFFALARALGWRDGRRHAMPRYGKFVAGPAEYPVGFFPTLRNPQREQYQGWPDSWRQTVMAVHLQLRRSGGP